jgi:type I restriction enzyme S subunit
MSKLNRLIQELCPDGVEYRKLGEIGEFENIGVDKKIVEGQSLVKLLNYVDVYKNAHINNSLPHMIVSASDKKIEACTCEEGDIFLTPTSETRDDIGHAAVVTETLSNTVYSYHIMRFRLTEKNMITSFFVRYLFETDIVQKQIYKLAKGLTRYGLSKYDFAKLSIPLPPLPIQEEIVKILDRFAEYTAELQAELQARKEQYEYYRNLLLTNNFAYGSADDKQKITGNARGEWKWMTLVEVCEKTKNIKWKEISPMQEYQYIDLSSVDRETSSITETQKITKDNAPSRAQQIVCTDDVIFGTTRPTLKRICFIPDIYDNQICSTGFCVLRAKRTIINPRFLYFSLTTSSFGSYVENNQEGAGYPSISNSKVMGYTIPVPPLAEQERIVSILDKFEALVSDLTQGLPAEIAASQERYEYYRDKLLRFERCN